MNGYVLLNKSGTRSIALIRSPLMSISAVSSLACSSCSDSHPGRALRHEVRSNGVLVPKGPIITTASPLKSPRVRALLIMVSAAHADCWMNLLSMALWPLTTRAASATLSLPLLINSWSTGFTLMVILLWILWLMFCAVDFPIAVIK